MRRLGFALLVVAGCDGTNHMAVDAHVDPPIDMGVPPIDMAVPIDSMRMPAIPIDEAPDCGGDPLVAHAGDAALVVSAIRIASAAEGFDLDGDGDPDNKLAAIGSISQSGFDDGLTMGTYVVPIELFDRDADPDACVKLGWYAGTCANASCNFTDATQDAVTIAAASLDAGGPRSRLRSMSTSATGAVAIEGPGYIDVRVPVQTGIDIVFPLSVQHVTGTFADLRFGGTIQAWRLERLPSPQLDQIGTMPGDTLLDVFFANLFGPLLALPKAPGVHGMMGCRAADIDIDGDGLEGFCDGDPNDDIKRVDYCVDGDGTVIHDAGGASCTDAMIGSVRRFPDGISAAFVVATKPVTIN